jgi:protein O-GlcNAc transferase
LRIGFISPDLKEHSVYYFLKSTLKSFKDRKIKILAFNLRKKNELDEKSYELKEEFDEWIDLSELNDLQAANLIIDKKVSILIDIAGHFARNRFRILKYKPSPLQISWMGFVNTTGIKEIDYLIADNNLIHQNEEHLYTEKILRLPKIWNCHSGFNENLNICESPLLKNNFLTFGCFNNSSKISEKCIIVWSKILSEIKNSKIVIKAQSEDSEIAHKKIIDKFKSNNIDEKRIIFKKHQKERIDHLKMYELIDISLDTFPYPGVTTSFESIWMGVPVLTMKGFNFVSRCGESININLDMKEFLAENEEDYILKAVEFSKNPKKIIEIRKTLRDKALNSPLFDKKMFGKEFCELIENTWKNYNKK